MSKITAALEAAVATVIENTPSDDVPQTARQRANADKAFAAILKLIAPRIRHFIRQYGLAGHWDDAEQCCAIGVHRAIQGYQPEKAQFTTFVNWQLRGELQSLRFRLMTDQRPSAKKVDATTVSLHAVVSGPDGDQSSLESLIVDEESLASTEAGASAYMTQGARGALTEQYVAHLRAVGVEQLKRKARAKRAGTQDVDDGRPRLRINTIDPADLAALDASIAELRTVAERRLFDDASLDEVEAETGIAKERVRQMAKRAAKTIADLAAEEPRFAMLSEAKTDLAARTAKAKAPAAPLLPSVSDPHNMLIEVTAVEISEEDAEKALTDGNTWLIELDRKGSSALH
jgi:RNA polymerase sigma-32 factor